MTNTNVGLADPEAAVRSAGHIPRVIFIVGWGRSGSTLLGNTIGELEGCVHVGEVHDLWSAYAAQYECGCGLPLPICPFWRRVDAVDEDVHNALAAPSDVHDQKRRHMRVRYVPKLLRERSIGPSLELPLQQYSRLVCKLFHALSSSTGATVIIDSTKSPAAAALLLQMPIEASFIHLVRDPRATGFSWRRHLTSDPAGARPMTRLGYLRNAASWLYWNAFAELIRRHVDPDRWLRVRYEDFVDSPERTLRQIAEKFGLPTRPWPVHEQTIHLNTHHIIEGNPSRFKVGARLVRIDDEWLTKMPLVARLVTVVIAAPLFVAYRYHRRWHEPRGRRK